MAKHEGDAVTMLQISGKDDEETRIDPIDLIQEKVEFSIDGMPLGADHRIPQDDRYKALRRAFKVWEDEDQIG